MEKEKKAREKLEGTVARKNEPLKKFSDKGKKWEKPVLEDVSGQVMAQPYIRFT